MRELLAWSRDLISCTGWSQRILISHSVLLLRSNNPFPPLLSFFPLLFPRKKIRNERQQEFEGNRSIDTALNWTWNSFAYVFIFFHVRLKCIKFFFRERQFSFTFDESSQFFYSSPLLSSREYPLRTRWNDFNDQSNDPVSLFPLHAFKEPFSKMIWICTRDT